MSEINNKIAECNNLYKEALQLKEVARKSHKDLAAFQAASDKYSQASDLIVNEILNDSEITISNATQCKALASYYNYEKLDCLYAVEYKQGHMDVAIDVANRAKEAIDSALKIIADNLEVVGPQTKAFLVKMQTNWLASAILVKIKMVEPLAKEAVRRRDYVAALDHYSVMLNLQQEGYEYEQVANFDPVYLRIAKGNYIAMNANVAQTTGAIITQKTNVGDQYDWSKDILRHFLKAYELGITAFDANPEQDNYKRGADQIRDNISTLLKNNKNKWFQYLVEFNSNFYLKAIMQQTDNKEYKKQLAKTELQKDKTKQFLIIGLFWIATLFAVAYVLINLGESKMSWYRFIATLFGIPLLFTIVGAFVLRGTDGLKEENFMKLIQLALKMNFQGLKALSSKNGHGTNKASDSDKPDTGDEN